MLKISKPSRFHLAGTVLPFLLCGFAASSTLTPSVAHAQNITVGVIDEDRLADGYKKYKAAVDAIDKRTQNLDSQIQAREYLSEDEGKTFDTLIVKLNPTPDEAKKLKAVIQTGMDNRATWSGLIGKASRTPEEKTKMNALQEQAARNAPALRTTSDALLAGIRKQQDDTDKQYTERADSVVAQVAADKKFSIIARKKALVWSAPSVDITDEVLKRLNAGESSRHNRKRIRKIRVMSSPFRSLKAPRRSNSKQGWKRRGAFFGACLLAGAGLLTVSNRALSGLSIFPTSDATSDATTTPLSDAQARALAKKRNRSLSNALAKIDAKTVRAWMDRWNQSSRAANGNGPKLVRIDAETLARRHPAWRLADALERGTISPASPQIARALKISASSGAANLTRAIPDPLGAAPNRPATTLRDQTSRGETARLNARQSAALDAFFRAAAARDAQRGRDQAYLSRRALEDAIAASQNGVVPDLDLSLMSPEVALELTNLRLQLLRNLSKTPAERAAVREEIRVIEARYAQILREETARQAARLRAARVDIPLQKRRQGLEEIARQNRLNAQNRSAARRALARDVARLRLSGRDAGGLQLDLPPARVVSNPNFGSLADSRTRSAESDVQFFKTGGFNSASGAPILNRRIEAMDAKGVGASSRRANRATVALLRQRARLEAQQWARLAAGNLGATRSDSSAAPDATQAALQILFPAPDR